MLPHNLLPILAAALVPMIVGSVWFHPRAFGTVWMSLKHITPDMANSAARRSYSTMFLLFIAGLSCSLLLAYVLGALRVTSGTESILIATALWLGFTVPATIGRLVWDHIPLQLYLIETGQWLVSLVIMAIVLVY